MINEFLNLFSIKLYEKIDIKNNGKIAINFI